MTSRARISRAGVEPIDAGAVPVIDIASLRDGTDPGGVGAELARAATEVGFLYVRNHGVDAAVVERARRAAFAFFRLPDEEKREAGTDCCATRPVRGRESVRSWPNS